MSDGWGYAVLFPSGTQVWGCDASDLLEQMCGGWNPDTVAELRCALARRAGIENRATLESVSLLSDEEFCSMMNERNFWTMKRVPTELAASRRG